MLTDSITTLLSLGWTRSTRPRAPLSLPAITRTLSSRLMLVFFVIFLLLPLQHFRGERDYLHEPGLAKFASNRSKDTRPLRILAASLGENHRCVVIKPDV